MATMVSISRCFGHTGTRTHDSPKYVTQGIPLVTSKNLKKGKIDLTKIKYIKNEDYLLIKKRSGVSVGDVLMAMIGTIGNPVIVKKNNNFAIMCYVENSSSKCILRVRRVIEELAPPKFKENGVL